VGGAIGLERRIGIARAVKDMTEYGVRRKVFGIQRERVPHGRECDVVLPHERVHIRRERVHDRRKWVDRARPFDLCDGLVVPQRA
jgi:hypothetical protein